MQIAEGIQRVLSERGIEIGSSNWIQAEALPLPQRDLLAHSSDMTSTLEAYYRSEIGIEVLAFEELEHSYIREVVLVAKEAKLAVEYGVIEIDLDQFEPEQRNLILEGREPLGGILNRFKAKYGSGPLGYFRVPTPNICRAKFECENREELYGRYNQLTGPDGSVFATIVEILSNCNSVENT